MTIYETVSVTKTAAPVTKYETMKVEITSTVTVIPRNTPEMASSTSFQSAAHTSSSTIASSIASGNAAAGANGHDSNAEETTSGASNVSATAVSQQQATNLAFSRTSATTTGGNASETTAAYTIVPTENGAVSKHHITNLGFLTIILLLLSVI